MSKSFKVISIGQFSSGSFGAYARGCDSSDVVMYYAVEGDRNAQGFPNFASPSKADVESYARGLEEARKPLPVGKTEFKQKIIAGIGRAIVDAAHANDPDEVERLREMAQKVADWPFGWPINEAIVKYVVYGK